MYNVTQGFLNAIKTANRQFQTSVTVRDIIFGDSKIVEWSLEENVNPSDSIMLGSVAASKFEITLLDVPNTLILEGAVVTPKIRLLVGTTYEEVPLGIFTVDEITKEKGTVKLTCFDNMIKLEKAYFSNLAYPASINSVAQEICSKAGVQLETTLPNTVVNKIEGYTYREAISFIASFLGGFARFNRVGKLVIISYAASNLEVTGDNYFNLNTAEKAFTIGRLACQVGENILSVGASGNEVKFENPIMTQAQLNSIYNTLKTLSYMPYSMDWQGNPALMAGDKIAITDIKGNTYNTLLMKQKLTYRGGLKSSASAVGKTEQAQEFNSGGSIKNKVDRLVTEQANIKVLLAEKATIQDLTAVNARIDNLYTTDLTAVNAKISNLEATRATITELNAEKARIDSLFSTSATITQLNAANAKITTLEGKTASIEHILAGNITTEHIKAGTITAGSGIIANGAIGDAQISSLSAGKLKSGTVDTALVTISGPNGRLQIKGNKLQIFDNKSGQLYERIMLGIDDLNNSALTLRGADGTTVLLTQDGLTKAGFTDGYNKIDNDSLDPAKIDIVKTVVRINNGITTIQGSKIFVDNTTLDVSFSTLKNTVNSQGETISSHSSSITSMDGAIKLKVDSQTYNTKMSSIDGSISSINTSLNKATSDISVLQGEIQLKVSTATYEAGIQSAKDYADLKDYGANFKIYNNVFGFTQNTANVTGSLVIETNIPMSGLMCSIGLKGYNYVTKNNDIDINIGFYAYNNPISFLQHGYTNKGTLPVKEIKVALNASNKVVLIINPVNYIWQYPKIFIDKMIVAYNIIPADIQKNWTASIKSDLSAYTLVTTLSSDINLPVMHTRISTAESSITQLNSSISLKVESSVFETYKNSTDNSIISLTSRVDVAEHKLSADSIVSTVRGSTAYQGDLSGKESSITKGNTAPTAPANNQLWLDTSTTPNILKRYNGTAWVKATPSTAGEVGAYSGSDGSALAGRVSTAESNITQLNNSITSKVSQTDFNALNGRVNTAESTISQHTNQIATKVDVNGVKSTIQQNPSSVQIGFNGINNNVQIDGSGLSVTVGNLNVKDVGKTIFNASKDGYGNVGIELGHLAIQKNAYIDFHSSGTSNDYDTRIIAGGGNSNVSQGNLGVNCAKVDLNDGKTGIAWFRLRKGTGDGASWATYNVGLDTWQGIGIGSDVGSGFSPKIIINGRNGNIDSVGNLTIGGSKNRAVQTENYGTRCLSAYETTESFFGDLGEGIINIDGECTIDIDKIFSETINTDHKYHVFIQCYSGNITKIERYKNYFIVKGEPNTEFTWELKAKQKGFEYDRLNDKDNNLQQDVIPSSALQELGYSINSSLEEDLMNNLDEFLLEGGI
ncbi:tail fiber protein [Clostridium polynesiense]|uniref:tail fiber protein n=1 Tax=Clostridium polynesiense TaxID=1325933 RepID=UPI0006949748|nr:tail fiber protein [Clostridium polynesiense]